MNHTLSIDRCAWASCIRWWWGGSLKTAVSRKASLLSFSVSMVKWMEGCWLFKCCKKSSTIQDGKGIVHVAFPDPRLVGWCSYSLFFETLSKLLAITAETGLPMAALSFACKSIRYTGGMWISMWVSEGQRFVQALAWCGLQALGCSRISAVRLVQRHWEERWLAVILCWKIPLSRFLGSFYCWWWIRTLTFLWKETRC